MNAGKQVYIASAAAIIAQEYRVKVTRQSTLFIDDDHRNVKLALKSDIRSMHYNVKDPALASVDHTAPGSLTVRGNGSGRLEADLIELFCSSSSSA